MLRYFCFGIFLFIFNTSQSCKKDSKTIVLSEIETQEIQKDFMPWITPEYVMGKFDPKAHEDFIQIDAKYADRAGLYLRREAYNAFVQMWSKAKEEDIFITIKSATRNFDYQKGIWERKWKGTTVLSDGTKASDIEHQKERALKILLYSSMPGTSRHHWGTDIDLNSFDNGYFSQNEGLRLYEWLQIHGPEFGFCQPYTAKTEGRSGYEEEKWHWSYVPLSTPLTQYCSTRIKNDMIQGFEGAITAKGIDVVQNYMLGISPQCL